VNIAERLATSVFQGSVGTYRLSPIPSSRHVKDDRRHLLQVAHGRVAGVVRVAAVGGDQAVEQRRGRSPG
jgi:hypothetical protein